MNRKTIVKIGIVALAVVIAAVAAVLTINYFRRPTIGELIKYNRVENLVGEKGSVRFSSRSTENPMASMEIFFIRENNVLQSAAMTVDSSGYALSYVQYNGLRYTVSNGVIFVACQPAYMNSANSGNEQTVASIFDSISKEKHNARPKQQSGKYVFEYQPPNTASRLVFTFNKDKACESVDMDGILYTFTYGGASSVFDEIRTLDFNDTVHLRIENLSSAARGFEEIDVPKGVMLRVSYNAYPKDYMLYLDEECETLYGDGKESKLFLTEDLVLYLKEVEPENPQ